MCGIAGILALPGSPSLVTRSEVERMRDAVAHRGPDGAGTWVSEDGRVGLGHRRLSIIDLSERAAQPMSNEDASIWVSFNGEIYNHGEVRGELEQLGGHVWKTDHSDTEVILHAFEQWGIDAIHRFRGMFAFALWDGRARELWLVRDRVGIKPLYYSVRNGRVRFASEIKAILELSDQPRELDEEALFFYLSFLTAPAPRTLFAGVKKVPAGSWIRFRMNGQVDESRYWDVLERARVPSNGDDASLATQVLEELRTSVRLRKVSDVPVGAFLSGGIDSSANVALLSEGGESVVKTFTVGFRGQSTYANETREARRIADLFHAEHHERLLGVEDLLEFLPRMVELQDEPIADPVCVPLYYLSKLARSNGIVVCQVGEGSDELFFGYPSWHTLHRLQRLGDVPGTGLAKRTALVGLGLAGRRATREYEFLRRSRHGLPVFWSGAEAFTDEEKGRLLSPRLRRKFAGMSGWDALAPIHQRFKQNWPTESAASWMTYSDLNLRLPELLLMRVDKMSMGVAVECRVPFLDHRFVELAFGVPAAVKMRHRTPKYLLKRATRGLIPDDVIDRKKQGFGVPVAEWLLHRLGEHAREEIRAMVARTDLFDAEEVERLLESGKGSRVWFLLNLSLWWKRFIA
ncbi:MAG: asparagine synthase (glutamine-hydrolyzing) [Myxococcales bacterium]|nr:asparagine synthase (glutamine-hydrolyzing) [Myxococcales bacterium]